MHKGLMQLMYFNLHPPTPSPFLSLIVGLSAVCCLLQGDGRLCRDLYIHRLNKVAVAQRKMSILLREDDWGGQCEVPGPTPCSGMGTLDCPGHVN